MAAAVVAVAFLVWTQIDTGDVDSAGCFALVALSLAAGLLAVCGP